jgi:hypothetical protein
MHGRQQFCGIVPRRLYKIFHSAIFKRMFRAALKGVFIIFLACVIFFTVFAETFIAGRLEHDCCGEGCSICLQIEAVQNLLRCFSLVMLLVFAAGLVLRVPGSARGAGVLSLYRLTPVALKVRLNS